jgi:hypothetical protein
MSRNAPFVSMPAGTGVPFARQQASGFVSGSYFSLLAL